MTLGFPWTTEVFLFFFLVGRLYSAWSSLKFNWTNLISATSLRFRDYEASQVCFIHIHWSISVGVSLMQFSCTDFLWPLLNKGLTALSFLLQLSNHFLSCLSEDIHASSFFVYNEMFSCYVLWKLYWPTPGSCVTLLVLARLCDIRHSNLQVRIVT